MRCHLQHTNMSVYTAIAKRRMRHDDSVSDSQQSYVDKLTIRRPSSTLSDIIRRSDLEGIRKKHFCPKDRQRNQRKSARDIAIETKVSVDIDEMA